MAQPNWCGKIRKHNDVQHAQAARSLRRYMGARSLAACWPREAPGIRDAFPLMIYTTRSDASKEWEPPWWPTSDRNRVRLHIGTVSGFASVRVAAFRLEQVSGFVGIRIDVHFAEISQHYTAFREPTVERQRVPYFDVNDARRVLLVDQRCDKRAKMPGERTSGAVYECRGALIRSFHDVLLAGGSARQGGSLCPPR